MWGVGLKTFWLGLGNSSVGLWVWDLGREVYCPNSRSFSFPRHGVVVGTQYFDETGIVAYHSIFSQITRCVLRTLNQSTLVTALNCEPQSWVSRAWGSTEFE